MTLGTDDTRSDRTPLWAYAWWAVAGALIGIGVVGLLTVGIVFLAAGVLVALVGFLRPGLRRGAAGAVGGLAVAPLYLAWLNRKGPGRVCSTAGSEVSCVEAWSPWPFVAVAAALIVGSVVLARRV
jgi:hypothetical protein